MIWTFVFFIEMCSKSSLATLFVMPTKPLTMFVHSECSLSIHDHYCASWFITTSYHFLFFRGSNIWNLTAHLSIPNVDLIFFDSSKTKWHMSLLQKPAAYKSINHSATLETVYDDRNPNESIVSNPIVGKISKSESKEGGVGNPHHFRTAGPRSP